MDCPWINNCIDHRNHAFFVRFLIVAIIGCVHAKIILGMSIYHGIHISSFCDIYQALNCSSKMAMIKPRSEMMQEELMEQEEKEFTVGPLSILAQSVKNNAQVLINCRNNKKLLGRVKAFDSHFNMVLENVKEIWTELPKTGKGKKKGSQSRVIASPRKCFAVATR
ncbi:unnamed protein product, partial [Mesorhabditis belari]|uniref:Multifunctional fusion protein n=1 Tax=Mesorhabditis belari TaxID=2138241 RepID=A0AAF3EKC7_9BILA